MTNSHELTKLISAAVISTLTAGALGFTTVAVADDPPTADSAPPADGQGGRHHNPAWAACKKQADDQKLEPGDARKEFMRNCINSSKSTNPSA